MRRRSEPVVRPIGARTEATRAGSGAEATLGTFERDERNCRAQKKRPPAEPEGECSDAPINGYLTAIDTLKATRHPRKVN